MSWHPTLDSIEGRAEPRRPGWRRRVVQNPDAGLPVLSGLGCWCGARFGHDWTGKADGAPHPRDWPGRVNGWAYREVRR